MVNSMSRKVFSEEKTGEFTTTITLKGFDLVTELVFNLFLKGNKDLEEIRDLALRGYNQANRE